MENITCDNDEKVYLLSNICFEGANTSVYECVKPYNFTISLVRKGTGLWMLLVGIVGVIGNAATLTTVPCAIHRRRHQLHKNVQTSTVFILNLSLIDFCHCLFYVLPQGILYFNETLPFGGIGCKIIIIFCVITVTCDMVAMALIALSRFLDLYIKERWRGFCRSKRNLTFLFVASWVPGILALPLIVLMSYDNIDLGWDCRYGVCGFIRSFEDTGADQVIQKQTVSDSEDYELWDLIHIYTFLIPLLSFLTISFSYVLIWYKVHKSTKYLSERSDMPDTLNQREMKMTKTILVLISISLFCWLPLPILKFNFLSFHDPNNSSSATSYVFYVIIQSIFVSQYALNFFIYISRCKSFRNAFLDVLYLVQREQNPELELKTLNKNRIRSQPNENE